MSKSRWLVLVSVMVMAVLAVGACQGQQNEEPVDTEIESQMDLEDAPCGPAYVDDVTVEETADGDYVAVVAGHYPAACDSLGMVEQTVDGDTITIEMCSVRPPDAMCAQQLTPFVETLPIETDELESGTYTVVVNEATTTLTIE